MLRILLIDDTPRKIGRLKSALIEYGERERRFGGR